MNDFYTELRDKGFFDWNEFITDRSLLDSAVTEINSYIEQDINNKLEYNYGRSEVRIWNAQNVIPSVKVLYSQLKKLNSFLFGDSDDFCVLAIITRPCSQKYFINRWHVDSLSFQRKFFLHLTDVTLSDGPFEFYPYTHSILARLYLSILNIGKAFYFSRFYRSKTYQLINDRYLPSSSKRFSYTCKKGDLLVADVRMLHRDSPCSSGGYRVALHCYLGANPNNFPNA